MNLSWSTGIPVDFFLNPPPPKHWSHVRHNDSATANGSGSCLLSCPPPTVRLVNISWKPAFAQARPTFDCPPIIESLALDYLRIGALILSRLRVESTAQRRPSNFHYPPIIERLERGPSEDARMLRILAQRRFCRCQKQNKKEEENLAAAQRCQRFSVCRAFFLPTMVVLESSD